MFESGIFLIDYVV